MLLLLLLLFFLNNSNSNDKVPRGSRSAAVLLNKGAAPTGFFFLAALLAKVLTSQKMSHPALFFISFCQLQESQRFHVSVQTRTDREEHIVGKCELWCSCHGPVISVSFLFMSCVFSGSFLWCLLLFPCCVPAHLTSLIFPSQLSNICLISPSLLQVSFPANHLLPHRLFPPLIALTFVSPPLSTCTSPLVSLFCTQSSVVSL